MTTGRTYDEQRFSPLKKINDGNVDKLGLAWSYKLDLDRGVEGQGRPEPPATTIVQT